MKVLCGNVGIIADGFITLAIGQQGVDAITTRVIQSLDAGFVELLRLPQTARAEAAGDFLKPLEPYMDSIGSYLHIIKVPANASFWEKYEYAFGSGSVDTSKAHVLAYIGSTGRSFRQRVKSEHMSQECRERSPCLHYAAMDEPGAESYWYLLAEASKGADAATIRITEACAIATMHTFTLNSYTTVLKTY